MVLYGELLPGGPRAASVRVMAGGRHQQLPVTGPRGSFSGELPPGDEGDRVVLDYLDAEGEVLHRDRRQYGVDSDTLACP